MEYVFVLQHEYEINEIDEVKFIGVFSSEDKASAVVDELILMPGFRNHPRDCFHIDKCKIDSFEWKEGFISWAEAASE